MRKNRQLDWSNIVRLVLCEMITLCTTVYAGGPTTEFDGAVEVQQNSPNADEVMLKVTVGATPTPVFTVDEDGDVTTKGNVNIGGTLKISGQQIDPNDLSDESILAKLNQNENLTGVWSFPDSTKIDGGFKAKDGTGVGLVDDSGTKGIWVEDGGEVGVGTSTPSAKLNVVGETGSYPGGSGETGVAVLAGDGGPGNYPGHSGGQGGPNTIAGGDGGMGGPYSYPAPQSGDGGAGGAVTITSGDGGLSGTGTYGHTGAGGDGGLVCVISGSGGHTYYSYNSGGDGGNIELTTGSGGYGSPQGSYGNVILVKNGGDVLVGTTAVPTYGDDPVLVFGDIGATLPTMGSNTAGIYADDVNGTVEMFAVDKAGNDTQLSSHNFSLFDPPQDATLPYSFYSRNRFLGVEMAVDTYRMALLLEGLTGEKLIYYRDLPEEQVVDVAEWQQAEQERLIREAKEAVLEATPEIEIDIADAWEPAEVIEETTRTEQYTVYDLDLENLQIVPIVETCVVTEGKPTGRFERRLKQDVRFDSETGKLYRRLTLDDVTLDATPEAPSLPQWVMDRLAGHSFRE